MKFQGALVKEQGVTFGIIIVKLHVLNSPSETASMRGGRSPCIWAGAYHPNGSGFKRCPDLLGQARYRQILGKGAGAGYSLAWIHA